VTPAKNRAMKTISGQESVPNAFEGAGSVNLTEDKRFLFATNGGDNSVSSFAVGADGGLTLLDTKATGNAVEGKSGTAKSLTFCPSTNSFSGFTVALSRINETRARNRRGVIPRRSGNYTYRLLENFVPRCDQWLALSQISSSNAQRNRFNQHEQETPDVRVLFTPY
jgi:hypothetical protein